MLLPNSMAQGLNKSRLWHSSIVIPRYHHRTSLNWFVGSTFFGTLFQYCLNPLEWPVWRTSMVGKKETQKISLFILHWSPVPGEQLGSCRAEEHGRGRQGRVKHWFFPSNARGKIAGTPRFCAVEKNKNQSFVQIFPYTWKESSIKF